MTNQITELLPCPFCGGAAEIYTPFHMLGKPGQAATYRGGVQCSKCRCQSNATTPPDDAIATWNHRAELSGVAGAAVKDSLTVESRGVFEAWLSTPAPPWYYANNEDAWHIWQAALASQTLLSQAVEVPDGWKLVPVEPTDAMQTAGAMAVRIDTTVLNKMLTANRVYRDMIAAAPQPKEPT